MKPFGFFLNYFKVYKLSFVIVILMVCGCDDCPSPSFQFFQGQAVTELG